MRLDDPRLEESRKQMEERIRKYDSLLVTVIKGHLAIEQMLDECLRASLFHSEYVGEQFSFARKTQVCRALALNQHQDKIWDVVFAINTLRNKVAHGQQDQVKKCVAQLRRVYLGALTAKQAEGMEKESDENVITVASATCSGFLVALEGEARARGEIIEKQWKPSM